MLMAVSLFQFKFQKFIRQEKLLATSDLDRDFRVSRRSSRLQKALFEQR
jgi:hypothetical protein